MGFHVGLDFESQRLVELVATDPSKVLGKLYSAYMLFLVGEPDQGELKWLLDNAKALDSLTGDYVAYAVFAQKFKVRVHANSTPVKRPPTSVGEISLDDIPRRSSVRTTVTRLVKRGAFGMVVDGDELTAITYGTDRVARALGILDKLPCVVVVDAVPQQDLCIIHLDAELTSALILILRKTMAVFSGDGSDKRIKSLADRIIRVQDLIALQHRRAAAPQRKIDRLTHKIEKLRGVIEYGRSDRRQDFEVVLQARYQERQELTKNLERVPKELAEGMSRLESELETLLREYRLHRHVLFSELLRKEVKSLGLQSRLAAGKTVASSFLGSLFKPDILLKLWTSMHSS